MSKWVEVIVMTSKQYLVEVPDTAANAEQEALDQVIELICTEFNEIKSSEINSPKEVESIKRHADEILYL
jgi:hypothetical protein